MNKYYEILSSYTEGKDTVVKIHISTLADLLDSSVLPERARDSIVHQAEKQIKAQQTP